MAERSFKREVQDLRLGDGETFTGEGILAITKALLESGVGYVGGYQGAPRNAISSTEVFVEVGDRFFPIDSRALARRRRFSHTATKLPSGRILILGGFSESGQSISESEYFDWRF